MLNFQKLKGVFGSSCLCLGFIELMDSRDWAIAVVGVNVL
jgi:hypothetical protein